MLIEVALVSEQTLANLLPALHERPDRTVLVASAEMARRGLDVRQRRLLKRFGIEAEIVGGAPDAELARIHEFALDLLARIETAHPGAAIVFNATGGNKLMMLGFVEVFRADARVIYADTQHGRCSRTVAAASASSGWPTRLGSGSSTNSDGPVTRRMRRRPCPPSGKPLRTFPNRAATRSTAGPQAGKRGSFVITGRSMGLRLNANIATCESRISKRWPKCSIFGTRQTFCLLPRHAANSGTLLGASRFWTGRRPLR